MNRARLGLALAGLAVCLAYLGAEAWLLDGRLGVGCAVNGRISHGGISFEDGATFSTTKAELHDVLLKEDFIYAGGDLAYALTDRIYLGLFGRFFVRGYSTRDQNLFGLSFNYNVK